MPSPRARRTRPLRIATYNILLGGPRREELITAVLSRIDADVIALQEVCNLQFLGEVAGRLGMQTMVGEPTDPLAGCHIATLTRLPVRSWQNRQHVGRMLRSHLQCDVETGWESRPVIGVHNVHLAARFGERAKGEARRMRELTAVLEGIAQAPPLPHLMLGDFNSIAPGDDVAATRFFRKLNELRRRGLVTVLPDGSIGPLPRSEADDNAIDAAWRAAGIDPRRDVGVPLLPRIVRPLTVNLPVRPALQRFLARAFEPAPTEPSQRPAYPDPLARLASG